MGLVVLGNVVAVHSEIPLVLHSGIKQSDAGLEELLDFLQFVARE